MLTVPLTSDLDGSKSDVRADVLIPQDTILVKLMLIVHQSQDLDYLVVVTNHEGTEIFKTDRLKPHESDAGKTIEVFMPANRLLDGDYVVRLSGMISGNESVTTANYYLRVRRY